MTAQQAHPDSDPVVAATAANHRPKLVVIDDDPAVRKLIRYAMDPRGYEVLPAGTAEEGELLLQGGDIPVALVDINLPGMSGMELVRHFADDCRVAIILMTGDNATYSYDQAIHEGAADFMAKPIRLDELTLRIDRAMETRRSRLAQDELVKQLERMAVTDELTGLPNRRRMMERLNDEVARAGRYGRPLTLLVIDIDQFKRINDRFGHVAGDAALKALGAILCNDVRTTDQAFRYGGEEFVILLPELKLPESVDVAERLRRDIDSRQLTLDPQEHITVSIGAAQYVQGEAPVTLLARADEAMYAAKKAGRNRVVSALPADDDSAEPIVFSVEHTPAPMRCEPTASR